MLTSLAFVLVSSLGRQARTFTFLSYQDTVFAVYNRGWVSASKFTEIPSYEINLTPLGMHALPGVYKGTPERWDGKALCYNVACEDFDHVLGCSVDPRYLRKTRVRDDLKQSAKAIALKQLQAEFKKRLINAKLTSVKDPNVYSVDLDGTGHEEILVDISAQSKGHNYGLALLYSPSFAPHTLAFKTDGWPRILSVVDLEMDRDRDRVMDVIVGGTTSLGKCVFLYKFNHNQLSLLATYDTLH